MRKLWLVGLVTGFLLILGCAKEETTGPEEQPPQLPSNLEANIPSVPSGAPLEVQTYGQIITNFHGLFSAYFNQMSSAIQNLPAQREGSSWVWQTTQNTFTVKIVATVKSDGTRHWEFYVTGQIDTVVVNNAKVVEGDISADGSQGDWTVYDPQTQTVLFTYSWTVDANNVLHATLTTAEGERLEFTQNPDGSGSFVVYRSDNTKAFEASWAADGSGNWKAYDETGQNVIGQGTWGPGGSQTPPQLPASVDEAVVEVPSTAPSEVQNYGQFFRGMRMNLQMMMNHMLNAYNHVQAHLVDSTWVWEFTQNGFTIRLTATLRPDSMYHWELYLNGTQGGTQYNNWKVLELDISADHSQGTLILYNENSTEIALRYNWSTDADGTISATLELNSTQKIVATRNADGSGWMKAYDNNNLVFEANWNADGSGSWIAYDANGNIIGQGTWG